MNVPEFYRHLNIFKYYIYQLVNVRYYSMADLVGRTGSTTGEKIYIDSYYPFSTYSKPGGGGWFVWKSNQAKSTHDGVTIISPTVPWDGSAGSIADFHAKTGETDSSGSGCWVRLYTYLSAKMAGVVGDGSVNDTSAITKTSSVANIDDMPMVIGKGSYSYSGTTYNVDGTFIWLNHGYTGAVSPVSQARNNALLVTTETSTDPVQSGTLSKVGINITATARGAQHGTGIRSNLVNYSTDGRGCTGMYARATNDAGAFWGAALHGETRHAGGTSICGNFEASSYSDTGSFYGIMVLNTTNGSEPTHSITGGALIAHSSATAMGVSGTNNTDPKGGWVYGLRFLVNSMRASGETIRIDANAPAYHLRVTSSATATAADILLEDNSPVGLICNGTYTSGNAIRLIGGQAIAFEGTGAIKQLYDSGTSSIQLRNGSTERFRFVFGASPTISLNGTQVLGTRKTGWSADTGTAKRTANATYSATASAAYDQAEIQALMDAVRDATQTIKALKDDHISHGIIGA